MYSLCGYKYIQIPPAISTSIYSFIEPYTHPILIHPHPSIHPSFHLFIHSLNQSFIHNQLLEEREDQSNHSVNPFGQSIRSINHSTIQSFNHSTIESINCRRFYSKTITCQSINQLILLLIQREKGKPFFQTSSYEDYSKIERKSIIPSYLVSKRAPKYAIIDRRRAFTRLSVYQSTSLPVYLPIDQSTHHLTYLIYQKKPSSQPQ